MSIPVGIQMELDAAQMRTGQTPQLVRAAEVLRTMYECTPEEIEQWFWIQGQADAIAAVAAKAAVEDMDEYAQT